VQMACLQNSDTPHSDYSQSLALPDDIPNELKLQRAVAIAHYYGRYGLAWRIYFEWQTF